MRPVGALGYVFSSKPPGSVVRSNGDGDGTPKMLLSRISNVLSNEKAHFLDCGFS